jgi:hypothetical protein
LRIPRNNEIRSRLLFAPHEQPAFRTSRGQWIECRLVRAFVEQLRQRLFLRTSHRNSFAIDDLCDVRIAVVHVADQDRLRWTNDNARRFETYVDPVRAKVALLC